MFQTNCETLLVELQPALTCLTSKLFVPEYFITKNIINNFDRTILQASVKALEKFFEKSDGLHRLNEQPTT